MITKAQFDHALGAAFARCERECEQINIYLPQGSRTPVLRSRSEGRPDGGALTAHWLAAVCPAGNGAAVQWTGQLNDIMEV